MNAHQPQLFPARYPEIPGHRSADTSKEAAQSVDAGTLRAMAVRTLRDGPVTADECAAVNGVSSLAMRPRFSELRKLGKVFDTGSRRVNESGRNAIVWGLKDA